MPLFLGIWCFHPSNGTFGVEVFRFIGHWLVGLGLGLVLTALCGSYVPGVIGLCAGLLSAWLFEA